MKAAILSIFTLLCFSHSVLAETYKCVQSGETIYSTSPCGDNAQVVPNHILPRVDSQTMKDQEPYSVQAAPAQESPPTAKSEIAQDFKLPILVKIRRNIVLPPDVPPHTTVTFAVTLLPDGYVLDHRMIKPSGYGRFDKAVEHAILKSQPLPVPTDSESFKRFRELQLSFTPP